MNWKINKQEKIIKEELNFLKMKKKALNSLKKIIKKTNFFPYLEFNGNQIKVVYSGEIRKLTLLFNIRLDKIVVFHRPSSSLDVWNYHKETLKEVIVTVKNFIKSEDLNEKNNKKNKM